MKKMMLVGILVGLLSGLTILSAAMAADTVTMTGEVVDTYCYGLMGAKGESHRSCGISCAKAGIPMGLLQDGTDKLYVLLPNKDNSPLPPEVMDKMGRKATITGKIYSTGGSQFLTVESIK
jgi:type 1 fimbria pilin